MKSVWRAYKHWFGSSNTLLRRSEPGRNDCPQEQNIAIRHPLDASHTPKLRHRRYGDAFAFSIRCTRNSSSRPPRRTKILDTYVLCTYFSSTWNTTSNCLANVLGLASMADSGLPGGESNRSHGPRKHPGGSHKIDFYFRS